MASLLDEAVQALAAGGLVVYPTDTVLGLAAAAGDARAVRRLAAVKGRLDLQSVSVAVSSLEEIEPLATVRPAARGFLRRNLPGPITVLLRPSARARRSLAPSIAGGRRIGLRIPDHPVARELARRAGPITATSANLHGRPPARSVAEARAAFGRAVRVYLPARPPPSGRPSTLIDLAGPRPRAIERR